MIIYFQCFVPGWRSGPALSACSRPWCCWWRWWGSPPRAGTGRAPSPARPAASCNHTPSHSGHILTLNARSGIQMTKLMFEVVCCWAVSHLARLHQMSVLTLLTHLTISSSSGTTTLLLFCLSLKLRVLWLSFRISSSWQGSHYSLLVTLCTPCSPVLSGPRWSWWSCPAPLSTASAPPAWPRRRGERGSPGPAPWSLPLPACWSWASHTGPRLWTEPGNESGLVQCAGYDNLTSGNWSR